MPPRKRNRNTSAIEKNEDLVEVKGNKKRIYLTDFDKQVAIKREMIEREGQMLIKGIEQLFSLELMKLAKDVRSMQLPVFMASGGDVNAAANTEVEEGLAQELANLNKIKAKEQQKVFGPNPTKTSTIRSTKNRVVTKSVLRQTVEQTPKEDLANQSVAWPTPAITPKFDPRLPLSKETNFRKPRPGEKLTSMRGSLVVPNETITKADNGVSLLVSLNDGNAFQLDETTRLAQNSYPSVNSMDELKKLEAIKDQLATIIRYNKINMSSVKK